MNKKLFIYTSLALVMATACSDTDLIKDDLQHSGKGTRLTLTANPGSTRVELGDLNNGYYQLQWTEGDAIGIYSSTPGAEMENIAATLLKTADNGVSGIFCTDDALKSETEPTEITVYYPYKYGQKHSDTTFKSCTLATEQKQSAPNTSTAIGEYGFSYAKTTIQPDEEAASFTLTHTMAYVKFEISSTELAAYRLAGVTLYDRDNKTPLSGAYSVNTETGTLKIGKEPLAYATVNVTDAQPLSSKQELYLTTFPANLEGKQVYVVVTLEDDKSVVNIPILRDGHELKAGALNTIKISDLKLSDNACDWYEPIETRLLVDGWAYGDSNCLMTEISTAGVDHTIDVKARGKFTEVEKPMYTKVVLNCDLNANHKMIYVNGVNGDFAPVNSDYTVNVNTKKVSGGYDGGCGQIAIYGEDKQTVIWAFTIWMTTPPAVYKYNGTPYEVMDRNLGAYENAEKLDNWKANGIYMQWGRPTPVGWSASAGTTEATGAHDVRYSIERPRAFLYYNNVSNTHSDWYLGAQTGNRSDRKDDLWGNPNETDNPQNPSDGHKSIYDPCPKGYRLISPGVVKEITDKAAFVKQKGIGVLKYCYDGTNYDYWPAAGAKWGSNGGNSGDNTGLKSNANGTAACYWTNSPAANMGSATTGHNATCLYYKVLSASWTTNTGRGSAFSIRCMRDTENR